VCLYAFFLPWGVSGVHIALGLGVLAWIVKSVAERKVTWVGKPVGWPVLVFVVVFLVASLKGWVLKETMREFVALRTLLAIFLVGTNLRSERGLQRLALLLIASLALFSLYAAAARLVMAANRKAVHVPLVVSKDQVERLDREGRLEGDAFWLPDLGSMSVLLIVAACVVAGACVPAVRTRVAQVFAGDDGQRLKLWRTVPKIVRDYPLGVGPGCSFHMLRTKKYVPPDVYYAMPDKVHFHSTIAELAVSAGPLAVGAYLWWFAAFGVWAVRRVRRMTKDSVSRAIVLGGLLAAVAFFVNGLVEYNLGDSDVTLMLYLIMGTAMAVPAATVATREPERDRRDAVKAEM
jgi:hypothetical protein